MVSKCINRFSLVAGLLLQFTKAQTGIRKGCDTPFKQRSACCCHLQINFFSDFLLESLICVNIVGGMTRKVKSFKEVSRHAESQKGEYNGFEESASQPWCTWECGFETILSLHILRFGHSSFVIFLSFIVTSKEKNSGVFHSNVILVLFRLCHTCHALQRREKEKY